MYLEHFGLREAPFRVTPHTEFFYSGGNWGATLEALVYAITHDEGIVKVSGEVGSGKTMLCRALVDRLPDSVSTVYLANPSLSREEFLFVIADGLGMQPGDSRIHQLMRSLQERLKKIRAEGKQVIVIIDEAHALPGEALEEICRLSNLEQDHRKLLQFVLVGQQDLDLRLRQPDMHQLRERVTHNFAIEPLKGSYIGGYLMFRMRAAGYEGPYVFTPAAIQIIAQASEGVTRRINLLADKALLAAAANGVRQVDEREARTAVVDAQFGPLPGSRRQIARRVAAGIAGLFVVAGAAYLLLRAPQGDTPAFTASSPPVQAATVADDREDREDREVPAASAVAPPAAPSALPSPSAEPAHAATPVDAAPESPPESTARPLPEHVGPLTRAYIARSATWLRETDDNRHFIQLMNTDTRNAAVVENFLSQNEGALDREQLRVYRSDLSGRDRIGVIYGDYPSQEAARAAIETLPETIRRARPFVRTIGKLR